MFWLFLEKLEKISTRNDSNLNFLSCAAEAEGIRRQLITLRNLVILGRRNYISDIGHSRRLIASYTEGCLLDILIAFTSKIISAYKIILLNKFGKILSNN